MNLKQERKLWRKAMKDGTFEVPIIQEYCANRGSESWRTSSTIEQLCEYILFLEEQLEQSKQPD